MLEILGVFLSAIGALMAFTHGGMGSEDAAMKQLFIGIVLFLAGMLFILFKPAKII